MQNINLYIEYNIIYIPPWKMELNSPKLSSCKNYLNNIQRIEYNVIFFSEVTRNLYIILTPQMIYTVLL